jgi:hypothetical protein
MLQVRSSMVMLIFLTRLEIRLPDATASEALGRLPIASTTRFASLEHFYNTWYCR